jgi:hypothetical protein
VLPLPLSCITFDPSSQPVHTHRRMQHVPLYLEWAPQGALVRESKVDTAEAQAHGAKAKAENSANDGMTDGGQEDEDDAEKEV